MVLEYFGEFGRILSTNPLSGDGDFTVAVENPLLHGVGAYVDGEIVAAYCIKGKLFFRIASNEWEFPEEFDSLEFCNEGDGMSRLILKKEGVGVMQYTYRSWWHREGSGEPLGFGDVDDQEHDIGAYLAFMFADHKRRDFLLQKWR